MTAVLGAGPPDRPGAGGPGPTLADLLDDCADRRPDHPAYVYPAGPVSWAAVRDRVDAVAAGLAARGVRPGTRVLLAVEDGPVLIETTYALARLGAVRIGLNWRFAPAAAARLVGHAEPALAVVQDAHRALLEDTGVPLLGCGDGQAELGEWGELAAGAPLPAAERPAVTAGDLAAIAYTTGSTGDPKGARWTHRNVVEAVTRTAQAVGMRPQDVWLHCLPGAGVPYLLAVWNAVLGWTSVVTPRFDAGWCLDAIEREQVTATVWVPTMLHDVLVAQAAAPRALSTLRTVAYGSAPATPALVRRAAETFGAAALQQWYGSTEGAGGWFTLLSGADHVEALAGREDLLTSCGRAMPHVALRLVDTDGAEVPAGEPGEVCVRSATVMSGYHRQPELSARVLAGGWLRTGDIGRLDPDGALHLIDRRDFMVVTGGYNVYPVQVENVLAEHPGVAESCVFGTPDERWGEALVALVVPAPGASPTPEELRAHCRQRLAAFMVPKVVELVDALRRGPTGKVAKLEHRTRYAAGDGP